MLFLTVISYIGLGLAGLIAAYAVYMLAVAVVPGFKVPGAAFGGKTTARTPERGRAARAPGRCPL